MLFNIYYLFILDSIREVFMNEGLIEVVCKIVRENVDHDDDPLLLLSHSLRAIENIGKFRTFC